MEGSELILYATSQNFGWLPNDVVCACRAQFFLAAVAVENTEGSYTDLFCTEDISRRRAVSFRASVIR